jgi:AmmeMemoRadiSam system protein A
MSISREEGLELVALARSAVIAAANGAAPPCPEATPVNARHAGAFVTIHARGELRGCIGQPEPRDALGNVVVHCARAAALEDPRFPPLSIRELPFVDVEVSVLTVPVRVSDPASVEVGRHGLIVARGGRRGLLLPQVPVEWGWTREEFLARTCQKAGLPLDAWQHGAELYSFEAEIFSEADRR